MSSNGKRDYYEILGISSEGSPEEIKAAYRRAAFKYHPDRNPGDKEAEERFKEAAEAYEVLSTPEKRARYDRYGFNGVKGDVFAGSTQDIFDMFSDFFSGGIFDQFTGGGRRRRGPRQGDTRSIKIQIKFAELAKPNQRQIEFERLDRCGVCNGTGAQSGGLKVCKTCGGVGEVMSNHGFIAIRTTCPRCNGAGKVLEKPCPECRGAGRIKAKRKLSVTVPPGIEDGTRIRIPGEGDEGEPGAPRGDLLVYIVVKPHKIFNRRGQDVYCEIAIPFHRAALGGAIDVPTLFGTVELKVPEGTQPGAMLKMRGIGLPYPDGSGRKGDQYVSIIVEVPKRVKGQKRELIEQLGNLIGDEVKPRTKGVFERFKDIFFEDE